MSLLRILRNLAVLLILVVLASTPRSAAGGDGKHPKQPPRTCGYGGQECGPSFLPPCCPGLVCTYGGDRFFCENPFDETIE